MRFVPAGPVVRRVAFSPDGRWLAVASEDANVALHPTGGTGEAVKVPRSRDAHAVAFHPRGTHLAYAAGGRLCVRKLSNGETETLLDGWDVRELLYHPDGRVLALVDHDGARYLAGWSPGETHPSLWRDGSYLRHLGIDGTGTRGISATDHTYASCYTGLWGVCLGPPVRHLKGNWTVAARLSPDGEVVLTLCTAVLSAHRFGPTVSPAVANHHPGGFADAAFFPDGSKFLTVGPSGTARLWRTSPLEEVAAWDWALGPLTCVAVAPDGLVAAAGTEWSRVLLWDLEG